MSGAGCPPYGRGQSPYGYQQQQGGFSAHGTSRGSGYGGQQPTQGFGLTSNQDAWTKQIASTPNAKNWKSSAGLSSSSRRQAFSSEIPPQNSLELRPKFNPVWSDPDGRSTAPRAYSLDPRPRMNIVDFDLPRNTTTKHLNNPQ